MAAVTLTKRSNHDCLPTGGKGYSLFELLVTLSIAAILLLIALPNFRVFVDKMNLETRVDLLLLSIKDAKIAALHSEGNIIICRKPARQLHCAGNSVSGRSDWRFGWLVFEDNNADKIYQPDEHLISAISLNANNCTLQWNRGDLLSFEKYRLLQGGKAGSFKLGCVDQSTQLVINWVGRVRRKD